MLLRLIGNSAQDQTEQHAQQVTQNPTFLPYRQLSHPRVSIPTYEFDPNFYPISFPMLVQPPLPPAALTPGFRSLPLQTPWMTSNPSLKEYIGYVTEIKTNTPTAIEHQQSIYVPDFLRNTSDDVQKRFHKIVFNSNESFQQKQNKLDQLVSTLDRRNQEMYDRYQRTKELEEREKRERVHTMVSKMSKEAQVVFAKLSAVLMNPEMKDIDRINKINDFYKSVVAVVFMTILFIIGIFIFHAFIYYLYNEYLVLRRKYPPGPIPLPFVGNFFQIDLAYPHRSMIQWKKKFGPLFTIWLPGPIIVLADYKVLREALLSHGSVFAGRPMSFVYGIFSNHHPDGDGIILSQNERWSQQRRFALKVFRDFGMGKNMMEQKIRHYADTLVQHLKKEIEDGGLKTAVTDLHLPITFCVGNIIQDLVLGKNCQYGDQEFLRFKKLIDSTLKDFVSIPMLLVDRYPIVRFLLPTYYRYCKNGFALQRFFLRHIEEHEKAIDASTDKGDEPNDFIDAYLKNMISKLTLALNSGDLWTGGMETTVTTLRWAIIYLIHNPDVQKLVHDEIDRNLGTRMVHWADRNVMHYTLAVICEVQRIVNVLPWHIPHATTCDSTLYGYKIQKGTVIMPQIGAINFDENFYPSPETFQPSRFLDSEGTLRNFEHLIPFGIGKRSCLGEALARMELFVILTTLLQNFEFSAAYGKLPSLRRSPGMVSVPQDYMCQIRGRNEVP
uniref:SXP/RAL-2 family protein Ani s 5-like cation-binding domain-containing protein n=1 Tax=Setaria digitata TaxID=48799 RepID=A0A915PPI1_9BILA